MAQAVRTPLRQSAVSDRFRTGLRLAGLIALLAALGYGGDALRPQLFGGGQSGAAMEGASWEGRRLTAQVLWGQAHAVLHAGVEEREARAGEAQTRQNEFHGHDDHADHYEAANLAEGEHEAGHVLVIPPKHEDFRGVLGDLERTVKPYTAPDGKPYAKDPDQAIPLYRLMTMADPHFVQAYTTGATFIARGGARAEEGLAFLREGERHNPESFEIQMELGHFALIYGKRPREAIRRLERARAGLPTGRPLNDLETDARADTYHWLAYAYRAVGDKARVREVAAEGVRVMGEDRLLERLAKEASGR
jgi:hypothetical protein